MGCVQLLVVLDERRRVGQHSHPVVLEEGAR